MSRSLRALLEVWLHCPGCSTARAFCPTCGAGWQFSWPLPPSSFPAVMDDGCDCCGTALRLVAVGWQPNPTGEGGPRPEQLSDDLRRLERSWHRPTAQRPAAAVAAPPAPPPPPSRPRPCPSDAPRHRLATWAGRGMVPEGLAPATVAKGYRRAFGVDPRRDAHHRQVRAYSMRELGMALGALGLCFPPDPLRAVWTRSLQLVDLPSNRALLSQQCRLLELRESDYPRSARGELVARVAVAPDWLEAVQSRRDLLGNALCEATGSLVAVELGVAR